MVNHLPWDATEQRLLRRLASPEKIQAFIETLPYNIDNCTYSPRFVIRKKRAHCFDGALFAAAALEFHGHTPQILDLRANGEDDDHVLAVFKVDGHWGAIAASNYSGCRYRDPVYRSIRELVMSYFNIYFNLAGRKTLREYSMPFDLRRLKGINWRTTDENLDSLSEQLDALPHRKVIARSMERRLAIADDRLFKAETLTLDKRGAFKVKGARM